MAAVGGAICVASFLSGSGSLSRVTPLLHHGDELVVLLFFVGDMKHDTEYLATLRRQANHPKRFSYRGIELLRRAAETQ